ncbi:MAG: ABC transporter ATP-binding protein [Syntrophobacter sp.]
MSMLNVTGLNVNYGDTRVLWDIAFEIGEGQFISLVGANGAGKTTFLRTVVGLVSAVSGRIEFNGLDVTAVPVEARIRSGLAMVPEGRRLFKGMTVLNNILIGAYFRKDRQGVQEDLEKVIGYFPELERLGNRTAGDLSGGEQQMCAIGRALMARPRLLLVDEMSLGLAPVIVERLAEVLARINIEQGMSIILVEQDVEIALELSSRGYVIDNGRIVMMGQSSELLANPKIRETYMGLV